MLKGDFQKGRMPSSRLFGKRSKKKTQSRLTDQATESGSKHVLFSILEVPSYK
jgi:hypothetical protein